jgi:hypothetical protein
MYSGVMMRKLKGGGVSVKDFAICLSAEHDVIKPRNRIIPGIMRFDMADFIFITSLLHFFQQFAAKGLSVFNAFLQ